MDAHWFSSVVFREAWRPPPEPAEFTPSTAPRCGDGHFKGLRGCKPLGLGIVARAFVVFGLAGVSPQNAIDKTQNNLTDTLKYPTHP